MTSLIASLLNIFKKPVDANCDSFRTIKQIVESRGFGFEEHSIQTDDGHLLIAHRLINPFVNDVIVKKPVILQHGLASNSIHWLITSDDGHAIDPNANVHCDEKSPCNNLPFALANCGYDVWLVNSRGNNYSLGHKTLNNEDDLEFWDYSLDEMITFDLPATINYVLRKSKSSTTGFIGISQGTAIMFGLLASQPQFNDVIKPFIALAPVTRYTNCTSPMRYAPTLISATIGSGQGRGLSTSWFRHLSGGHWFEGPIQRVMHMVGFSIFGFNYDQLNEDRLKVFHGHPIGDFSWKSFRHHNQMFWDNCFRRFDYGKEENFKIYGQVSDDLS